MLRVLVLGALLAGCAGSEQPDGVTLLRPYLQELIAATNEEFNAEGVFLRSSPHRARAEELFDTLLRNETPAGDRALAYLLFVYNGEHPGEELVCEVARRGKRMISLIDEYSSKLPITGMEPFPKFIQGSGALPPMAKEMIGRGETCDAEE